MRIGESAGVRLWERRPQGRGGGRAMGGWGRRRRRGVGRLGVAKETGGLVLCGFGLAFLRWDVGTESFSRYSPRDAKVQYCT